MPRTTLDLDAMVLLELRRRGRRQGKSMGQVASEVLARAMRSEDESAPTPFRWHVADLGQPRIDLEDKEAVRAALDGPS